MRVSHLVCMQRKDSLLRKEGEGDSFVVVSVLESFRLISLHPLLAPSPLLRDFIAVSHLRLFPISVADHSRETSERDQPAWQAGRQAGRQARCV